MSDPKHAKLTFETTRDHADYLGTIRTPTQSSVPHTVASDSGRFERYIVRRPRLTKAVRVPLKEIEDQKRASG